MRLVLQSGSLMLAVVITSLPVAADDGVKEFRHVKRAHLRKSLEHALPEGLRWVDDKLALDDRGEPYWLPAVRAEKSGFYVLRHSYRYNGATRNELGKSGQKRAVYYFYIGKKGASRAHSPVSGNSQFDARYPTACEGDVIVAPFKVASILVQHEFSHDGPDAKRTKIIKSMIDEPDYWLRTVADSLAPGCELTNRAESRLRHLGAKMQIGHSRLIPGPTYYTWIAAFEAKQVGAFNLQFDGPKRCKTPPPISIRIVDAKTPLRVVLANYETVTGSDQFSANGRVLRVGDRIRTTCLTYRHTSSDRQPPIKNPTITAHAKPFTLRTWTPFGIDPAKIE